MSFKAECMPSYVVNKLCMVHSSTHQARESRSKACRRRNTGIGDSCEEVMPLAWCMCNILLMRRRTMWQQREVPIILAPTCAQIIKRCCCKSHVYQRIG